MRHASISILGLLAALPQRGLILESSVVAMTEAGAMLEVGADGAPCVHCELLLQDFTLFWQNGILLGPLRHLKQFHQ